MDALILSAALDTNGQNARYVKAARKHGREESVLLALAIGNADPAGVVGRYQSAATRHPVGLRIRSAHKTRAYFDFPTDLVWDPHDKAALREIRQLAKDADVIHLNNSDVAVRQFSVQRKPMLLHHHGSMFRNNPQRMLDIAASRKMVQAVSTVDLREPAPELLHWLPTAYDVKALQKFARQNRRTEDGRIRIVHCPTNRELKRTDLLIRVVDDLTAEGLPIDLVLVEGRTNAESLAEKAKADIVFDQLMYGYGCNAVEAWGMGKPVISGAEPWTTAEMRKMWGDTPYAHATEKTLKTIVRKLVTSADARAETAAKGLEHVRRYHDELPALERLAELYHDAIAAKTKPRIEGKGVLFRSTKRVMTVDGVTVAFNGGTVEVKDAEVIRRLRNLQQTRPRFGVEEVA